jgi:hypothetical protein
MCRTVKVVTFASVYVLAGPWGFDRLGAVGVQEEWPPARSARGGIPAKTAQHRFKVFFYPTVVRVLPQNAAGEPVGVLWIAGTATFYHPNSPEPWFSRRLRATPDKRSTSSGRLAVGGAPAATRVSSVADESSIRVGRID